MKKIFSLLLFLLIVNHLSIFSESTSPQRVYIRFRAGTSIQRILEFLSKQKLDYEQLLQYEQSITFKLKNNKKIEPLSPSNLAEIIHCEDPLLRTFEVSISQGTDAIKFCQKIIKINPEIEIAEPVYPDFPLGIPNDTYASQQTMLAIIKAFETWDSFIGDTSVVIGIVDTGVLQEHEDLQNSIAPNWNEIPDNGIDDDGNGFVDDFKGCNLSFPKEGTGGGTYHQNEHGTAVAGIAGATTNNARGIAGVAYKCRIFPVKASNMNSNTIDYGYKGILYCALRGFQVVNCSWGRIKPYSPIDQSIIDYAVARGVVIVAAGGNGDGSPYVWYPAGYRGVLGVGEVNQVDNVTPTTTLNHTTRIMAPGIGNWITKNQPNSYDAPNYGGTSWSAPVISGVVAMVRARYPGLEPRQVIEYVRQLGDDISNLNTNPFIRKLIPLRVNLLKLLSTDPMSIPGISPLKIITSRSNGIPSERFIVGDTVVLRIEVKNYLAEARNLRFVLSLANEFETSISILDDEVLLGSVPSGTEIQIAPFRFIVMEKKQDLVFLRVDIYGENNYHDFFLIPFIPTSPIKNFQNDSIYVSISDKGTIGFYGSGESRIGNGFGSFSFGNQLYKAGLLASENDQKVVTALFSFNPDGSDFRVVKPFLPPDDSIGIIDDYLATDLERIGIQISQKVEFASPSANFFKIYFEAKNISTRVLSDFALGYFIDLDVGDNSDSNSTVVEAIYDNSIEGKLIGAAQYVLSRDSNIVVGIAAANIEPNEPFLPQSAGMNSDFTSNFNKEKMIQVMKSNLSLQYTGISDISIFSGMRFPGQIAPNETRKFLMLFAIGRSREQLSQTFASEISLTSVWNKNDVDRFFIIPNPVVDKFRIEIPEQFSIARVDIFNSLGQKVLEKSFSGQNFLEFDSNGLAPGFYFLRLMSTNKILYKNFIKF